MMRKVQLQVYDPDSVIPNLIQIDEFECELPPEDSYTNRQFGIWADLFVEVSKRGYAPRFWSIDGEVYVVTVHNQGSQGSSGYNINHIKPEHKALKRELAND